jgi:hypothetical protein
MRKRGREWRRGEERRDKERRGVRRARRKEEEG